MSEERTLEEFADTEVEDDQVSVKETDELDQEQFGPFTLSTPGDWTAKRLGDIKQLITRGKQPTYADDGVPVINQECIYWDGWHFENLRNLDEEVAEDWKEKYFPEQGDVILNSTGQGTLGRAQVYPDEVKRAIDSHVTLVRTNDQLDPYFYRYFLESHLGQALLYSMCVNGSTGQIELSKTRMDLLPVPIPPLEEQRKIASFLYDIDLMIQRTDDLIHQIASVKKGLLQDLLNQDRFEDSNLVHIRDLGEWGGGSTPSKRNEDYWGGTVPWLAPKDIFTQEQNRISDTEKYLTEEGAKETNLYPEGSVAVVVRSGVLDRMLPVAKIENDMAVNQDIKILTPDSADSDYLLYALEAHSSKIRQRSRKQGTTWVDSIQMLPFMRYELPVPERTRQREIVDRLLPFDDLLVNERRYLKHLNRLKRGLMQDLLSGEVRTTGADIEILDEVLAHG